MTLAALPGAPLRVWQTPAAALTALGADHRIGLLSLYKCSFTVHRLRLFLFSLSFPFASPPSLYPLPAFLSFFFLRFVRTDALGVFLCWNSFAGCLGNSGLWFSPTTPTPQPASGGQASRKSVVGTGWRTLLMAHSCSSVWGRVGN